jgi:hypothetical protein
MENVSFMVSAVNLLLVSVIPIGFIGGMIWLQIYLSRLESRWPGLILPALSFGMTLLTVLSLVLFTTRTTTVGEANVILHTEQITPFSEHEEKLFAQSPPQPVETYTYSTRLADSGTIGFSIGVFVSVFFMGLFPTVLFLTIYFICRSKIKKRFSQSDINRMSVQDLG